MGMRGQYKNKRDGNEKDIFATIEANGFVIWPLDTPCDAIVGRKGVTYLIEVKNGPKAGLSGPQKKFRAKWTGHYQILSTIEEAEDWARKIRGLENDR